MAEVEAVPVPIDGQGFAVERRVEAGAEGTARRRGARRTSSRSARC